jgi:hypothetical protein
MKKITVIAGLLTLIFFGMPINSQQKSATELAREKVLNKIKQDEKEKNFITLTTKLSPARPQGRTLFRDETLVNLHEALKLLQDLSQDYFSSEQYSQLRALAEQRYLQAVQAELDLTKNLVPGLGNFLINNRKWVTIAATIAFLPALGAGILIPPIYHSKIFKSYLEQRPEKQLEIVQEIIPLLEKIDQEINNRMS